MTPFCAHLNTDLLWWWQRNLWYSLLFPPHQEFWQHLDIREAKATLMQNHSSGDSIASGKGSLSLTSGNFSPYYRQWKCLDISQTKAILM